MTRPTAAGLCVVGTVLLCSVSFRAQGQGPTGPIQSWACLTSSAVQGSIFAGAQRGDAGCATTPVVHPWPGGRRVEALAAPPGAPIGLTASVSGQTVTLTWAPASTGGTPTSYIVQAGSSSGLANLVNAGTGSASPSLTATGVALGTYYVRVLAQNDAGVSGASAEIVVVVSGSCGLVPAVPTGLATSSNGSNVTLTWQAPPAGCPPTSFIIQAGTSAGLSNLANFSTGSTATSFSASGVSAGTYYVRVIAVNAAGTSGPSPDVVLVVGGGGCSAPPSASGGLISSVSGSTVSFSWLAATGSPTAYFLLAGTSPGTSNAATLNVGNATNYTAAGAPNGTYYVRVVATNACGSGPASNEVTVVVGGSGASVLTAVHGFQGSPSDGSNWSTLTVASDGNFYGTAVTGGPSNSACTTNLGGCGLLFKMTPVGALTVLYTFTGSTADHNATPIYPYGALVQATDGNFYGTTSQGPSVFKMTTDGTVTTLTYLGGGSYSKMVQGSDGNLYGTTALGGPGNCSADRSAVCTPQSGTNGTVFKVSLSGTLTTLHTFSGGTDGGKPYGGVILGSDGNLYGTTNVGGAGYGTIYRIATDGTFATLYTFTGGADGANPYGPLVQGSDGAFYGSTVNGGGSANAGTVFQMTTAGAFTVLHAFTGFSVPDTAPRPGVPVDGAFPAAPLIQLADGRFLGVTAGGGSGSGGTAFTVNAAGTYQQISAFSGNAEGSSPIWLIKGNDGAYYGDCQYGGVANKGAIFRLTPP